MTLPKFIITMNVVLRLGMVNQHKDLPKPGERLRVGELCSGIRLRVGELCSGIRLRELKIGGHRESQRLRVGASAGTNGRYICHTQNDCRFYSILIATLLKSRYEITQFS